MSTYINLCFLAVGFGIAWFVFAMKKKKVEKAYLQLQDELSQTKEIAYQQSRTILEKSVGLLEVKEQLEAEQAKSKALLLNILPQHVIDELENTGKSTPKYVGSVTVFFSDIVGFTTRCAKLKPTIIVEELNDIFTNFDRIFTANGCERIKTIGDAYMAIAGLYPVTEDHCQRIIHAALEARRYLVKRNAENELHWEMRMGIHSGPVVAGIVGTKRYLYDVFGDTVNTAARMEQFSETMQINVSEASQKLVADQYKFILRPPTEVKGKGVLDMYFLDVQESPHETRL